MSIYKHECGQRYLRTLKKTPPPRHGFVLCERCLEPMPVCDDDRTAFAYEPFGEVTVRRLLSPVLDRDAKGQRPVLRRPLFPARLWTSDEKRPIPATR